MKIRKPRRLPRQRSSAVIVFACAALGLFIGILFAREVSEIPIILSFLIPFVGLIAGSSFGIGLEVILLQKRLERAQQQRNEDGPLRRSALPNVEPNPHSFRKRLAQFTDQKEEDVLEETRPRSNMAFWQAGRSHGGKPPRTSAWIHAILMRIRRILYDK